MRTNSDSKLALIRSAWTLQSSVWPSLRRRGWLSALSALVIVAAVCSLSAGLAVAGVADTPLPQFSDLKSSVLISTIPGVVKRNGLETEFVCTSLDSALVDIGVEIFGPDGSLLNDVSAGTGAILDVAPGQTVTLATSSTATYSETLVITLPPGANLAQGSARIVASSSQVRCNIMMLDKAVTPPVALATLGEGVKPTTSLLPPGIPLPQFSDGQVATHSALFPGVISRLSMETAFLCTSLSSTNINVGIELLNSDGSIVNSIVGGVGALLNVAPGQTVTFSTSGTAAFFEESVLSVPSTIAQGLARVVATSSQLRCNAVVLDATLSPATAFSGLLGAIEGGDGGGPTHSDPFPTFADGKASVHVLTVSGVLKRVQLQTLFICTSVDSAPVDIGVQLYDLNGILLNDVTAGVGAILDVAPGQTATIGTSATATFTETGIIPVQDGLQGLGRVVASSDQVRCIATVVDDLVLPPLTLSTLGRVVQPAAGGLPASVALPQFASGNQATHSVDFPGLIKRLDAETDIFCSSIATGAIDIGVQVFKPDGTLANDVTAGNGAILGVTPGSTVTFGTTGTLAIFENTVIVLPGIAQGMARVVSNSDQLLCSAAVVDAGNSPPGAMSSLVGFGAGAAVCGDGVLQQGEQCDGADDAACPGLCGGGGACLCPAVCGDGFIQAGEQCDDAGTLNGDCCSSSCQFETLGASCSDGDACNGLEACDGAGVCVVGVSVECDDGDPCTQDSCVASTGSCVNDASPATTCVIGTVAGLQIKDKITKPKDQLKWKLSRGASFGQGALGDPSTTATYTVCVYDSSAGVASLATSLSIPPSAKWQSKSPKGWQYKDKSGTFDGVQKIKLKTGSAGKTKVQLIAKGGSLPTPIPFSSSAFFEQSPDVTVQMFNSDTSTCWSSSFATATKNTVAQFKAKVK